MATIYYFDSAPFTSNATGGGKKGLLEVMAPPATTFPIAGHDSYLMKYADRTRFTSDCTTLTLRAVCTGTPTISLYQRQSDGTWQLISSQDATGIANVATITWSGLSGTHEYILTSDKPDDSAHATYYHYVELDGGGILDVGHTTIFDYEYGNSRTAQHILPTIEEGHTWPASLIADHFIGFNKNGSGEGVTVAGSPSSGTTWFLSNVATIPATVDRMFFPGGINDCLFGTIDATFQSLYETTLTNIRGQIGAGKPIYCFQPLPCTDGTANTQRATAGTKIIAAIASVADADIIYIPTDNWWARNSTDLPDAVHPSAAAEAKYANRLAPIVADSAISISGPSVLTQGAVSSNFTVEILPGCTFTGDQTVTITCSDAGATVTPSVGSPGTGAATVTPTNGATGFTFTVNPAAAGSGKTITPTSGQSGWTMPSALTYTANSSTVTSVTVSPPTATLYGGQTQQFTAVVGGTGSPPQTVTWSVDNDGDITEDGLFTAPGGLASGPQLFTVTAASTQDPGITDDAAITVPTHQAGGSGSGSGYSGFPTFGVKNA